MAWPVLVFDIESIPDVAGLRATRGAPADLSDAQVYAAWAEERRAAGQSDFLPLYLQRILVISCVFRSSEGLRVHSFVDRDNASEGRVVQSFFNSIEKHVPQLVSWNAGNTWLPSMPSLPGNPQSLAIASSGAFARGWYIASRSIRSRCRMWYRLM